VQLAGTEVKSARGGLVKDAYVDFRQAGVPR
jgi:hypothetical protein